MNLNPFPYLNMLRRFWEQNWPSILAIWITLVISAFAIKLLFFNHKKSGDNNVTIQEMLEGLQQNDSRLIDYILKKHMLPPSSRSSEYAFKSSTDINTTFWNSYLIRKILKRKMNGFFVEYRAYDGEFKSKTLNLEKKYKWTGVLIEPDATLFPKLVSKHRKAWLSNACLSPDPHSQTMEFMRRVHSNNKDLVRIDIGNDSSKLDDSQREIKLKSEKKQKFWHKVRISCFPLFSILSALNMRKIDYLILSAQGLELQILLNIPWHSVSISVLSIDVQWISGGGEALISFMKLKDYRLVFQVYQDYIFAHQSLGLSFLDIVNDK